tara:strand:+ start:139 stop:498 length:360 start_codon:yes stop_codon:yes gene_type:complete
MWWIYLFYEDVLISKYKGTTEKDILKQIAELGNECIIQGMKVNHKFPEQIKAYHDFLSQMKQRKLDKAGIHRRNHQLILGCISALVKLKQLSIDESYILLKIKTKKHKGARKGSVISET